MNENCVVKSETAVDEATVEEEGTKAAEKAVKESTNTADDGKSQS